MIYVIRPKKSDIVKIGFTRNPSTLKLRLRSLKTGCPQKLKVEATMPGSKIKERCMHCFCVKRHVSGEWFRLTIEEVQRMVAKYRDWTPASSGIRKMGCIHNSKKKMLSFTYEEIRNHDVKYIPRPPVEMIPADARIPDNPPW